ncbi:MAG: NAD(P)-dependent dehydrogenase (short-subunit alcohol dehydrogenase family) [Porticoccaceae bacterium]|jgi:NAD(P)-dependent dehydrogenase (short-subunit alcohol dehydrogenase family)
MISEQQKPVNSGFGAKSEPAEVMAGINLSGKIAVVTGGYSGIGLETVRALNACGARVLVPARRVEVAREALKGIVDDGDVIALDLADIQSVRACVASITSIVNSIDILINNAGVMACPETRVGDGWELQFAANHLGHFVLTLGLLPALKMSGNARVVVLSSTAHKISAIRWNDLHFASEYDKWQAYGQSKTADSLFAIALDERMKDSGIRAFSVHPGGIMTPLQRHLDLEEMIALGWLDKDGQPSAMAASMFKTPSQGATTTLWAATSPQLDNMGGVYCENCDVAALQQDGPEARYVGVAPWAVDTEQAERLWTLSEKAIV